MAEKYSAAWVAEQFRDKGARLLKHHDCSICGYWVHYVLADDGSVWFNGNCGCGCNQPPRPSNYSDIANWLAMQSSDAMRDRIMDRLQ